MVLLLLDVGLEEDSILASVLSGVGSSFGMLYDPVSPPYPLLVLFKELSLLMFGPGCALQRLFTLSERFIMALWTKPPMPFVGELGRSGAFAIRACEDDVLSVRLRVDWSASVVKDD